jgi:DNA-directed RNA polymerase subunit RPC12/RpoP
MSYNDSGESDLGDGKETDQTTYGCGHCGQRFTDMQAMQEHVKQCDVIACLACDTEFDNRKAKSEHHCKVLAEQDTSDPEAEWREEQRRQKRYRAFRLRQLRDGKRF